MKRYALLSKQGTACAETVLTEKDYNEFNRAKIERECCGENAHHDDEPVPGTWTDVSDNEACGGADPDDKMIPLNVRQIELDTILAALRFWQRQGNLSHLPEYDIATNGRTGDNETSALDDAEIDELCERINA